MSKNTHNFRKKKEREKRKKKTMCVCKKMRMEKMQVVTMREKTVLGWCRGSASNDDSDGCRDFLVCKAAELSAECFGGV